MRNRRDPTRSASRARRYVFPYGGRRTLSTVMIQISALPSRLEKRSTDPASAERHQRLYARRCTSEGYDSKRDTNLEPFPRDPRDGSSFSGSHVHNA